MWICCNLIVLYLYYQFPSPIQGTTKQTAGEIIGNKTFFETNIITYKTSVGVLLLEGISIILPNDVLVEYFSALR